MLCTHLTKTESAPSGVTTDAGAKPYAAKLHNSPSPMVIKPIHH